MKNTQTTEAESELRAQYGKYMLPVYAPPSPVLSRGRGSRVWDLDGREYVDFGGGVAVLSLGHAPPPLAAALRAQSDALWHTSNLYANDAGVRLARKLAEETFAARVFLCNSGTEANEAAIKLARRRGVNLRADKFRVLAFDNGFHGRTGFAMAATGQAKVREGFGALPPGFSFAPFNDLRAAEKMLDENVCAIIAEPVQGEGGVIPAAPGFLRGLGELAARADALLILDEIQTGAGRTGALYAYMEENITPDILTSAKGLGGGFPTAAVLCGDKAADALPPGSHGSTFGGNPLASRVALAVLEEITKPGFLAGVKERGAEFTRRLRALNEKFKCFTEVRGRGLLVGCPLREGLQAAEIAAAALAAGVLVLTAGGNTLRFAPALNIPPEDIKEGFARLQTTLEKFAA
ncbi:MAG: aspartate aminotransferase family protein [Gammaproteobacteria bacterium]